MLNFKIIHPGNVLPPKSAVAGTSLSMTFLHPDKGAGGGIILRHTDPTLDLIEAASRQDSVEGILKVTCLAFTQSLDSFFRITGVATLNKIEMTGRITHRYIADSSIVVAIKDGINRQDKIEEVSRLLAKEHQLAAALAGELLVFATKEKDNETAHHVKRMAGMSNELERLTRNLESKRPEACPADWEDLEKLSPEQKLIAYALHDLGKVGIPDRILKFAGKLSEPDMAVMKTHAGAIVARIFDGLNGSILGKPEQERGINAIRVVATQHHERYDGTGYPNGIFGKNIHIMARIASICDVYDALRSVRPYKKAFDQTLALRIMSEGRGTQFDPVLLALFISNIEIFENIRVEYPDSNEDVMAQVNSSSETLQGGLFQHKQLIHMIGEDLSSLKTMLKDDVRHWLESKMQIPPSEELLEWFIAQLSIMKPPITLPFIFGRVRLFLLIPYRFIMRFFWKIT